MLQRTLEKESNLWKSQDSLTSFAALGFNRLFHSHPYPSLSRSRVKSIPANISAGDQWRDKEGVTWGSRIMDKEKIVDIIENKCGRNIG